MRSRLLLALTLGLAPACSSGLGGFAGNEPDPPEPNPNPVRAELGLGFDTGVALAAAIDDGVQTLGIRVPGAEEGEERDIVLVAFSTASPADDADGAAGLVTPLVKDAVAPVDANDASDVFLAALEDQLLETELDGVQPVAFDRALVNVFRHTRCVTCHAVGHETPTGELSGFPFESGFVHPGDNLAGGDPSITSEDPIKCQTCHNQAQVSDLGALAVEWRAPLPLTAEELGIPFEFDLRGKSVEELNERAQALDNDLHMRVDSRVRWAIESGRVPDLTSGNPQGILASSSQGWVDSGRDVEVGPVPIDYRTFLAQVDAWEQGGFQATAASSVRDLVLVSEALSGEAADGPSTVPSLAFVPNGAFTAGGTEPFGTVVVAYVSEATDLTVDASPTDGGGEPIADVFVSFFDLFVADGEVDLVRRDETELVSAAAGGGSGANGASGAPVLDAEGTRVAFVSSATDFGGFVDGNAGAEDVFLADLGADTLVPLSLRDGSATDGGDGASLAPAISSDGAFVVFESAATDLVADDTNGLVDIFLVDVDADELERVSVTSDDAEGSGGDCRSATVTNVEAGPIVAFESEMTDLTAETVEATRNVFLREGGVTTLLSQERSGASSTPGNGDSHSPRIGPAGDWVVYLSEADNLDFFFGDDENEVADVLLVDLEQFRINGDVKARRLTLSALREDASAATSAAVVTSFRTPEDDDEGGFVLFRTEAENLGRSATTDLVGIFLNNDAVLQVTDFAPDPERTLVGRTVTFENLSTDIDTAQFAWDFGDGITSNLRDPVHAFTTADRFEVTLTVTRGEGDDAVATSVMRFVDVLEHPGAAFTATPDFGFSPLSVAFEHDPGSNDGLDEAVFVWTVEGEDPVTDDAEFEFTFENAGDTDLDFDVTLDVTLLGQTESTQTTITVQPTVNAAFNLQRSGEAPLTVDLEDLTEETVTARTWTVTRAGDAGFELTSTDATFSPTLTVPDTYTVELCVTVEGDQEFCAEKTVDALAVSWADIYDNVFAAGYWTSCTGCHTGGAPGGGLVLDLTDVEGTRTNLVNQPEGSAAAACNGKVRVVPGSPNTSLLWEVVDPDIIECNAAENMPQLNDPEALERFTNWILQGANP